MIEPKADKSAVPLWITVPIILAAVACGGWILWRSLKGSGDDVEVAHVTLPADGATLVTPGGARIRPIRPATIQPQPPPVILNQQPVPKAPVAMSPVDLGTGRTAIKPVGALNNRWTINGKALQITVVRNLAGINFIARVRPNADVPGDDELWKNRTRLLNLNSELELTPQQQTNLAPLIQNLSFPLVAADRTQIQKGWDAIIAAKDEATKSAEEKTLVAVIDAIGVKGIPAVVASHSAQIRALLTPAQIQKFHDIINPHPAAAAPAVNVPVATPPAVPPAMPAVTPPVTPAAIPATNPATSPAL